MEPTDAHHPHKPRSLSETMYPIRRSQDSELLEAFGKENLYQIESHWTTQGCSAPFLETSHGYPSKPPETVVSVREASYELQPGVNVIPQRPSSDGSEDSELVHCYTYNNHAVLRINDFTYRVVPDSEISGTLIPRTTTVPDMAQDMERGPQSAEEFAGGAPLEGIGNMSFLGTGEHPPPSGDHSTSQYPSDSNYILRFIRRSDGGGATCLWENQGHTCGFFSQIDLVKRHIKRMHICLK